MGQFDPVEITILNNMDDVHTDRHSSYQGRVYMYGIWHIYNYGHWIHDNLFAMYTTMVEHGGIDRNNRIIALAVHQWDRPANEKDPYEANGQFMKMFEVFSKHKVERLDDFEDISK